MARRQNICVQCVLRWNRMKKAPRLHWKKSEPRSADFHLNLTERTVLAQHEARAADASLRTANADYTAGIAVVEADRAAVRAFRSQGLSTEAAMAAEQDGSLTDWLAALDDEESALEGTLNAAQEGRDAAMSRRRTTMGLRRGLAPEVRSISSVGGGGGSRSLFAPSPKW